MDQVSTNIMTLIYKSIIPLKNDFPEAPEQRVSQGYIKPGNREGSKPLPRLRTMRHHQPSLLGQQGSAESNGFALLRPLLKNFDIAVASMLVALLSPGTDFV
ncbi:hypothetical protein VTO42DRAFT_613 [Malbranchea cinnamomea]